MEKDIALALKGVEQRIAQAEQQAQRAAGEVQLIAVSKTFPADAIRQAWQCGQRAYGENYVQEFAGKVEELKDLPIEWHFIGPIQSNKTRIVASSAHWVHSVDRLKIAERLSQQRADSAAALNICLQVNVSGEHSKSGCVPAEVLQLARQVNALPRLNLRGLMCIPEATQDPSQLAAQFGLLKQLLVELQQQGFNLDTLSMGMSSDLELAVREGATMVRVGSAIFGARHYL
jgi:pyridoxal phosphate enzyme (YggS family)